MTQEELEKLQIIDQLRTASEAQLRVYEQEKLVQHSEEAKAYIERLAQHERRKLWKTNTNTPLLIHVVEQQQR